VTSIAGSEQSFSAAWETATGTNHLVESTSPAMPRTDAPDLAPS
jgi:hypothetical protein